MDPRDASKTSGIALRLSGGGYRAMLFHVGSLWRLNESGYLARLDRVSSVSGGSISAGSGVLWRFSKPYTWDYRVGEIENPTFRVAVAVAASSAFAPFLSRLTLELGGVVFKPGSGKDMQRPPYTGKAVLTDGGVYDNLGLETAWKLYDTILVSDVGAGKIFSRP